MSKRTRRVIDIVSACCMAILSTGIIVTSAIAIMIDSPGHPLFVQPRIGQGPKIFNVYKLRTMTKDGGETRVGKGLRKTGIDELPQWWNILKGEMSLVGGRPLVQNMAMSQETLKRFELYDRGLLGNFGLSVGPGRSL